MNHYKPASVVASTLLDTDNLTLHLRTYSNN